MLATPLRMWLPLLTQPQGSLALSRGLGAAAQKCGALLKLTGLCWFTLPADLAQARCVSLRVYAAFITCLTTSDFYKYPTASLLSPFPLAAGHLSSRHAVTGRSAALWHWGNKHHRPQGGRLVPPAFSEEIHRFFCCWGRCQGPWWSGWEANSGACLRAASDCAGTMSPRQEGMISGKAETFRINHSYHHFFLV